VVNNSDPNVAPPLRVNMDSCRGVVTHPDAILLHERISIRPGTNSYRSRKRFDPARLHGVYRVLAGCLHLLGPLPSVPVAQFVMTVGI
jgi:hypothetical protein